MPVAACFAEEDYVVGPFVCAHGEPVRCPTCGTPLVPATTEDGQAFGALCPKCMGEKSTPADEHELKEIFVNVPGASEHVRKSLN
jgi:hypothetical protein